MENQPRDESRAATVREGGNESWTEAAEFIDDPSMLPTARASGSFGEASGERPTPSGGFQSTVGQQQTRSPHGSDFSSSAAPVGQGSNTPVGDEPDTFQEWDARQPAPGPDSDGMLMMPGRWSMGGLLAAGIASALAMFWWRRRQARQSRYARLQQRLMGAGLSAGSDLPRMIGRATAKSGSPWLPFVLLPIALWLRERGKTGRQASEQLLEPLELERQANDWPGREEMRSKRTPGTGFDRSIPTRAGVQAGLRSSSPELPSAARTWRISAAGSDFHRR